MVVQSFLPKRRPISTQDVANLKMFPLGPASGVMIGSVVACRQMTMMGNYD